MRYGSIALSYFLTINQVEVSCKSSILMPVQDNVHEIDSGNSYERALYLNISVATRKTRRFMRGVQQRNTGYSAPLPLTFLLRGLLTHMHALFQGRVWAAMAGNM